MAFKTGIDKDRSAFAGMAILTAVCIGLVQDIPDQRRTITAMRVVTGAAFAKLSWIIWVFLLHRGQRMTTQAKRVSLFWQ